MQCRSHPPCMGALPVSASTPRTAKKPAGSCASVLRYQLFDFELCRGSELGIAEQAAGKELVRKGKSAGVDHFPELCERGIGTDQHDAQGSEMFDQVAIPSKQHTIFGGGKSHEVVVVSRRIERSIEAEHPQPSGEPRQHRISNETGIIHNIRCAFFHCT